MTLSDLSPGDRFYLTALRIPFVLRYKLDTTAICEPTEMPNHYATIRLDVPVEGVE